MHRSVILHIIHSQKRVRSVFIKKKEENRKEDRENITF